MLDKYINFVRGVSVNIVGKIGVVLTTSSFFTFVLLEVARIAGLLTNAYIGLITYLLLPALFIIGLLLIPIGWRMWKKQTGKTTQQLLSERFDDTDIKGGLFGSRLFLSVGIFTVINIIFLVGASSRMLTFMDGPEFCGTACHTVMNPEWVTYQQSPHARVDCVDCHVGEGVDALINSKLNGTWQMISVTFDLLDRPIPTPVHQLRPARETCEKCHWPDKFYGSRLKTITHYDSDEQSTRKFTTLNLKIDAGTGAKKSGIHWHVAAENLVRYASVDDERKEMIWVEVLEPDWSFKRYTNRRLKDVDPSHESIRVLDCVDCHNRATHIYEYPSDAIDSRIAAEMIDHSLPYIKREALKAVSAHYVDTAAAREGIANSIASFYRTTYPEVARSKFDAIDKSIAAAQAVYARNIHPYMNITWGSYPNFLGHRGNSGCFRCHNDNMVDDAGTPISSDCALCHSILAYGSEQAFEYLNPADTASKDYLMHEYLRQEFLDYIKK
ncbi:MAG: NapC/NirT family cytochrome c [Candidatus Zixiibacteriota bacterium]